MIRLVLSFTNNREFRRVRCMYFMFVVNYIIFAKICSLDYLFAIRERCFINNPIWNSCEVRSTRKNERRKVRSVSIISMIRISVVRKSFE